MTPDNKIIQLLRKEFEAEVPLTRRMLERVPEDKWDWKPHAKNMSMMALTVHLAELPGWPAMIMNTEGIDFATMDFTPTVVGSRAELLQLFEKAVDTGRAALAAATDAGLEPAWTMRSGDTIHSAQSKYETIRHAFAQGIHHRAQLGVYLRLLDIPLPGTYGPSADDNGF